MQIYNSMTRTKEEFKPIHPGKVNMYVCGVTAYDYCHLGHARSVIVFDVLVRYLRSLGLKVNFARNFTDVDDKIINKANQVGLSCDEVTAKYIAAFHEDMDRLNVLRADIEPRATEHISDMLKLCVKLIEQGNAYATPSGDVYFKVKSFKDYGKLSGRSLDDMLAGARIAPGEEKEYPLDFALWKASKPGEPFWESPWGQGRPGWHIECSAMSQKHLSLPLDIHGGGLDLIFPHHENEIAQSEAALGGEFCRYWVHNGFVQIDSEKMSKSLGNFKTIRDILEHYLPESLRFLLLTRHYRSPMDFSFEAIEEAEKNLQRIYQSLLNIQKKLTNNSWTQVTTKHNLEAEIDAIAADWQIAMADDLNTAAALGHLNNLIHLANRILEDKKLVKSLAAKAAFTKIMGYFQDWSKILGVFEIAPQKYLEDLKKLKINRNHVDCEKVIELINQRQAARAEKNFKLADELRENLINMGVEVRDTPEGIVWDLI